MIKILIPQDKKQGKASIRGLWLNDNKIYYDYLKEEFLNLDIDRINYKNRFYLYLEQIKKEYRQEAIFYNYKNKGYIYYNRDKIEVLNHRIIKQVLFKNLRQEIKKALRQYKGITIYIKDNNYILEVYYNG